jgi:hypothetical protein
MAVFTDSALAAASYTMTAVYLGDSTNATSTSAGVSETVDMIPTTTVIGTTPIPGTDPQVILVGTVVNDGTGPGPAGTVTFYNGSTSLGTATLNSNGIATLTLNLALGSSYNLDAVYSGDAVHSASTSKTVNSLSILPAFTLTATPSTVSVESSQTAAVTVTLTSTGNFADTVGMGCAALPPVVNCHFASVSLNLPAGGAVSTQLTFTTNNPLSGGTTAMDRHAGAEKFRFAGLFLPLGLGFGGILWQRRRCNPGIFTAALILVLTAAAFVATGCSNFSQASAAPGTYVIQVTGTGTITNTIEYQNITVNITQ